MIAGGGGDEWRHVAAACFSQREDRIERAADLVGERRLQRLELEEYVRIGGRREPRGRAQRCAQHPALDARGGGAYIREGDQGCAGRAAARRMSASCAA